MRNQRDQHHRLRHGFTLVEVLIAGIILALGLVGLAAVFPAVISQQQSANDLSTATSVSSSADALLATRLPYFRSRFSDPDVQNRLGTDWHRISSTVSNNGDAIYLQTPEDPDMRLRESESYDVPETGFGGGPVRRYRMRLPHRPLAQDGQAGDLEVVVELQVSGQPLVFKLVPLSQGNLIGRVFTEGQNAGGRLLPGEPNSIDYRNGIVEFHFQVNLGTEVVTDVRIDYRWLNDRLLAHRDRLYPQTQPRYGWEVAFRRSNDNQLQYTTFIYRFDGSNVDFLPESPGFNGIPNDDRGGMLRRDNASVIYMAKEDLYFLQTRGVGGDGMADQIEAGAWLLPVEGTNPVRVRREVENTNGSPRYELEGPPMQVDQFGNARPMTGNIEFWFVPSRIKQFDENLQEVGIWQIKTILATTKQVKL